jgi:hypothetical protein
MSLQTGGFTYTIPPAFWQAWSEYWMAKAGWVPPLHRYKNTMSGGVVFITPLGMPDLEDFLEVMKEHPALHIQGQGEELTNPLSWFGRWSGISVDIRVHDQSTQPRVMPPMPARPDWDVLRRL